MTKFVITKEILEELRIPKDLQQVALNLDLENEPKKIFKTKTDIEDFLKKDSILTIPWRKTINFTFIIIIILIWALTPLFFYVPTRWQEYAWVAVVCNVITSIIMTMFFIEGVNLRKYGFVLIGPSGILKRSEARFINFISWNDVKKIYQGESSNKNYAPEPMDNVCLKLSGKVDPIYFQWKNYDKQQFPSFILFFKLFGDAGRKYANLSENNIYLVEKELRDQLET